MADAGRQALTAEEVQSRDESGFGAGFIAHAEAEMLPRTECDVMIGVSGGRTGPPRVLSQC